VYTDMEWWEEIRQRVRNQGVSKREILRETGIHWSTLEKILEHPEPPGYRMRRPRPKPKLGPYLGRIRQIIEGDKALPNKQRHTAKRILERIREEGYSGGHTQLKSIKLRYILPARGTGPPPRSVCHGPEGTRRVGPTAGSGGNA